MSVHVDVDGGADVTVYRFSEFPPDSGPKANIITEFSHLLTEDERVGWRPNDEEDALEYPPVAMAWETWLVPEAGA